MFNNNINIIMIKNIKVTIDDIEYTYMILEKDNVTFYKAKVIHGSYIVHRVYK
jgi:hypothetical protein